MSKVIGKIAESKIKYHLSSAKATFEDKFKVICALQEIDLEFRKNNPHKKIKYYYRVWAK
ncbi:MAG: hypothetical protein AB1521_09780 [Bacteroidota bacterium]